MAPSTFRTRTILLLCLLCGPAVAQSTAPPVVPQHGLLVLRNGQVLQGDIHQLGDHYLLTLAGRSEVRLPVLQVDFYCRSLDDAYCHQRDRLNGHDPAAHLELAQWCLHQRLLPQASEQIEAARGKRVDQRRLEVLERRLRYLEAAPERKPTPTTAATTVRMPAALPNDSARDISPAAMERFTNQIQPLLLNRCGNSRCHGIASQSEFRLMRPNWSDTITLRMTQRNLQSVIETIDYEHPSGSRLLTAPIEPHGESQIPVFDEQAMDQYELLAAWVNLVAQPAVVEQPATIGQPAGVLLQPTSAFWSSAIDPASSGEQAAPLEPGQPAHDAPAPARQGFSSQDPFDPAIFNRRYHSTP